MFLDQQKTCITRYKSVEGVALASQDSLLTRVKSGPTRTTAGSYDFGASHGGGSCKQSVELSFSESVGKDESKVFEALDTNDDGRDNFINFGGGLDATHVDTGAVGAGDSHGA